MRGRILPREGRRRWLRKDICSYFYQREFFPGIERSPPRLYLEVPLGWERLQDENQLDDDGFLVLAEHAAQGIGDFADGGIGFDGGEDCRQEILRCDGAALEFGECGIDPCGITLRAQSVQACDLRTLDIFIHAQRGNTAFFFRNKLIYAHDDLLFCFDRTLEVISRLLNLALDKSGFNRAQRPSHRVDLRDVEPRERFDLARERFDGVRTRDGIDRVGHPGFVREDLLRAQRDERGG